MTKPVCLTPEQAEQARHLRVTKGMRIRAIARLLHVGEDAVRDAIHGAPKRGSRSEIHVNQNVRPPEDVIADRDRRKLLERQSLTASVCGDPLPGYSALDQRGAPL